MVKISIKKEEKTIKPKQKQKQKQSQKVIVNIGKDVVKPKRRRAPRKGLEKKNVVNKQQTTPTQINVPQALPIQQQPQQPMNELIKYLKENENQKEIIKQKDQKINELEKDKKDKERSKILTEDEVQDSFSNVYNNSNISSLTTSGTSTPRLSFPVDSNSLITALRRESDLGSENPNSGVISLSTPSNNLFSSSSNRSNSDRTFTTVATNNTTQTNLSSIRSEPFSFPVQHSNTLDVLLRSIPNTLTPLIVDSTPPATQDEVISDMTSTRVDQPVEETVAAIEDPIINEVLEDIEPENQLVVYGPNRVGESSTATEQTISNKNLIDNSIPSFLRPINAPLPAINFNTLTGQKPTIAETKDMRQKRIDKLDKKPDETSDKKVLAIEPQSTQAEAEDTIKLLERVLKQPISPEKGPEPHLDETPEQRAFKDKIKAMTNKEMGHLLRQNNIKGSDGKNFTVNQRGTSLGSSTQSKTVLKDYLLKAFNDGLIN